MRSMMIVLRATVVLSVAGTAGAQSFTLIPPDAGFDYAVIQDVAKGRGTALVLVSLQNSRPGPSPLAGYTLDLRTGARTDLADPNGSDLNPIAFSGQGTTVAGSLGGGPLADQHAFVWTRDTGVVDIGGLPAGNVSYATGVSDDGSVVVGTSGANFGDPYQQGWRWTADGFEPLADIGDDILVFGSAEDISGDGRTVVGTGSIGDFDPDTDDLASAVLWAGGGTTPTDMGNPPSPITTGGALPAAASRDGSVVVGFGPGYSGSGGFANRGFRWTAAGGFEDLGSVPGRPEGSVYVSDCSSDGGTVVGYSITGGVDTWESILWTRAAGWRTVRALLAERGVTVPAGIALRETFCNRDGSLLAGWAYDRATEKYRGFVAALGPLPCPADFNADGFLDFFDYLDFVTCFEGGDCGGETADYNADGFVDFFDYADFVGGFETGC